MRSKKRRNKREKKAAKIEMETFPAPQCARKISYASRNQARDGAIHMQKTLDEPFVFYRCRDGCRRYHVGHPKGWNAKNRRVA